MYECTVNTYSLNRIMTTSMTVPISIIPSKHVDINIHHGYVSMMGPKSI